MNPGLEKITQVRLPFDRRHSDDNKNYGIHGLDVWFILKGPKGAVQFAVNFGVYLPHVEAEFKAKPSAWPRESIMGIDVGYHAMEPQYEGQTQMEDCTVMGDKPCFYDGSALRAEEWAKEIFAVRGEVPEKLLWKKLEEEYQLRFERRRVEQ